MVKSGFNTRHYLLPALLAGLLQAGCATTQDYYSRDDFAGANKIDAHVHLNTVDPALVNLAMEDGFKLLTVNVDYGDFPQLQDQLTAALALKEAYPETVEFAATFSMQDWESPGSMERIVASLQAARERGAVAVKVWKNIGMDIRDSQQNILMVDDARLDPVFNYLEDSGVTLLGHQGEPHNCWLPLEEMTVTNDREYFSEHPQYHMFLHPEMPSYEAQMSARDNRLARHPGLKFAGAHLASLEWSVALMAEFLDRFPLARLDMAARMGQLQYQSKADYQSVREFFIKYQDRLMYATDLTQQPDGDVAELREEAHAKWFADWLYLTSDELITVPEVEGEFKGLRLPRVVIDKIYYSNAQAQFKAWCAAGQTKAGCIQ